MALHRTGYNNRSINLRAAAASVCAAALTLVVIAGAGYAMPVPDNQKALIEIRGSGVSPSSQITLSTGEKSTIAVNSDKNGQFVFKDLNYYSFVPLQFRLDLPEYKSDLVTTGKTSLIFDFNPEASRIIFSGKISAAGSVVINVDGVESDSRMTGEDGTFEMQLRTPLGLADGTSEMMANIINVGEVCCPKTLVPAPPIQLSISSMAVNQSAPLPTGTQKPRALTTKRPSYIVPAEPVEEQPEPKKEEPKKKKIPYLVTGSLEQNIQENVPEIAASISFPSSAYENTYVGGYKKMTDQVRDAIITHAMMIGAFLDGRATLASLGTLQKLNAQSMKDYAVSDSICKFGTLSRSIAGTQSLVEANKSAFSKIILDRNNQSQKTIDAEATQGMVDRMNNFKGKYCEGVDANSGLEAYCKATVGKPDEYYNRDVDFTRVFDTPLTLDVDYTDATLTPTEEKVLALFESLSFQEPEKDTSGEKQLNPEKTEDLQALRQNSAVRELVGNSFANLVAMKAKGTTASATYMQKTLVQLGLSAADAKKLIGDNPSYFAQMEILTKKLYQDPTFFANLYDTPANVARQRVAIKAISLMQDRDFLESLRRREILLSELLELRLRKKDLEENLSGVTAD